VIKQQHTEKKSSIVRSENKSSPAQLAQETVIDATNTSLPENVDRMQTDLE
jgi:hypothetical protein